MSSKRHPHPDLYDRMLAAGFQPDFPRPGRASSTAWPVWAFAVLLGLLIMLTVDRVTENRQPGSFLRDQSVPAVDS